MTSSQPPPPYVVDLLIELAGVVPVGGAVIDEQLRYLWINPLLAQIHGRSEEEHLGRTLHEVLGPLADAVAPHIRRVLDDREPVFDVAITGELGGRERSWQATYLPIGVDGRAAVGAVVIEVTERDAAQREARKRVSQQASVARIGRRALEGAGLQELFDKAVQELTHELEIEHAQVLELGPGGAEPVLRAGVDWQDGPAGEVRLQAGGPSAAVYSVAIGAGNDPWGMLGIHAVERHIFTADDVEYVQSVANVLAAAIDRGRAEEAVERVAAQRRRLIAEALDAGERERRVVADQLHDEVLQNLLFARQECKSGLADQDMSALSRASSALEEATRQVRAIVQSLHPVTLSHAGLATAIETVAHEEAQRGGFQVRVGVDSDAASRHDQLVLSLVREFLANVTKHAGATSASVFVQRSGGHIVLGVTDDGIGVDRDAVAGAVVEGHVGLASARERVEIVGGRIDISGASGRGTAIRVKLPVG